MSVIQYLRRDSEVDECAAGTSGMAVQLCRSRGAGALRLSVARHSGDCERSAQAVLEREFTALYSPMGRPSIPPKKLLRPILLQTFYSIRSERILMER